MDHKQQDHANVLVQRLTDEQTDTELARHCKDGPHSNQGNIPYINLNPFLNPEGGPHRNQEISPFRNQSDDPILNPEVGSCKRHIIVSRKDPFLDVEDGPHRNQGSGLHFQEVTEDGSFLLPGGDLQKNQGNGPHKNQGSGPYMNPEGGPQKYQVNGPFINPEGGPHKNQGYSPHLLHSSGPFINPEGGPHKNQCSGPFMNPEGGPQKNQGSGPYMNPEGGPPKNQGSGPYMNPEGGPHNNQGNSSYKSQGSGLFINPECGLQRYLENGPRNNQSHGPFLNLNSGPKRNQGNIPHRNKGACKMDDDDYQYAQYLQNEEVQKNIQHTALDAASTLVGKRPEISENKDAQYAHKLQKLEVRKQKRVDRTMAERLANKEKMEQCAAAAKESNSDAWYLPYESEEDYLVALQIQEQMNFEQQEQDLMLAQRLTDEQTKNEVERRHRGGPHRNRGYGLHGNRGNGSHRGGQFWNPEGGPHRNEGIGPYNSHGGPHNEQFNFINRFMNRNSRERRNRPHRFMAANNSPFFNPADIDDEFVSVRHGPSGMMSLLMSGSPGMIVPERIDLNDYDSLWELAEQLGEVRNCGASHDEIGQLPVHQYKDSSEMSSESKECHICLTEFKEGETLRSLPCVHVYHKECIDKWLKTNAICPVCRKSVKEG